MTREEANARWICCPMCDKKKCEREADDCDVKIHLENKTKSEGIGVTMENAIKYFKTHCKIFCDDFMKKVPENSIAYQATLKEKGFYDLAIKALEKPSVNETLDKIKIEVKAMLPPSGKWMYEEGHEAEHTVCEVVADVLNIIDEYRESDGEMESK